MKRDSDGFMILSRSGTVGRPPQAVTDFTNRKRLKTVDGIGAQRLSTVRETAVSTTQKEKFCIPLGASYAVPYQPKAWQHKAWSTIPPMKWDIPGLFHNSQSGNTKFRHLKALSVYLKVQLSGYNKKPCLVDVISGVHSKYLVAMTKKDVETLLNAWYHMVNNRVIEGIDEWKDSGYQYVEVIAKVLLVYDDKTIDSFCGNALQLFDILGLKFKNGRVIL